MVLCKCYGAIECDNYDKSFSNMKESVACQKNAALAIWQIPPFFSSPNDIVCSDLAIFRSAARTLCIFRVKFFFNYTNLISNYVQFYFSRI